MVPIWKLMPTKTSISINAFKHGDFSSLTGEMFELSNNANERAFRLRNRTRASDLELSTG
jgi:hypothetical protein